MYKTTVSDYALMDFGFQSVKPKVKRLEPQEHQGGHIYGFSGTAFKNIAPNKVCQEHLNRELLDGSQAERRKIKLEGGPGEEKTIKNKN